MSLFDYLLLTYLLWGWTRGRQRGLYRELYGIINALLILAMLAGYGLISSVWHWLSKLNQHTVHLSGVLGYVLVLCATVFLLLRIQHRLRQLKQGKAIATGIAGGILGVFRAILWSIAFMVINRMLPMNLFENLFIRQSVAMALLEPILEFFHVA